MKYTKMVVYFVIIWRLGKKLIPITKLGGNNMFNANCPVCGNRSPNQNTTYEGENIYRCKTHGYFMFKQLSSIKQSKKN